MVTIKDLHSPYSVVDLTVLLSQLLLNLAIGVVDVEILILSYSQQFRPVQHSGTWNCSPFLTALLHVDLCFAVTVGVSYDVALVSPGLHHSIVCYSCLINTISEAQVALTGGGGEGVHVIKQYRRYCLFSLLRRRFSYCVINYPDMPPPARASHLGLLHRQVTSFRLCTALLASSRSSAHWSVDSCLHPVFTAFSPSV